jgi:general secretion pathway protein A
LYLEYCLAIVRPILPESSEAVAPSTGTEEFYGFTTRPFTLSPDLRFVYQSRSHSHAFKQVTDALQRREGLVVITGEIGTGKTVLCRALLETFHEARTFLSVILDPLLGVDDLIYQVLGDFGITKRDARATHAPLPEATRHQLVTTLQQFLASLIALNAHAVIMIDEAQHLTPAVLEQIRLLSNFETDRAKLLQIVLVGQPNLEAMLRQPDLRQLDQRVARRIHLDPLSGDEVREYVTRRLAVASAPTLPFTPAALDLIRTISQGIPRVVNTLCDQALELGFERRARPIDRDIVAEASDRLKLPRVEPPPEPEHQRVSHLPEARPWQSAAIATGIGIVLALALWVWRSRPAAPEPQVPIRTTAAPTVPAAAAPSSSGGQGPSQRVVDNSPTTKAAPSNPGPAAAQPVAAAAPNVVAPPQTAKPSPSRTAPGVGSFRIAVAAFRTSKRANDVVAEISAIGLPVAARLDPTGEWYQVIVGPFATLEAATNAQKALERQGYQGTRIAVPNPDR